MRLYRFKHQERRKLRVEHVGKNGEKLIPTKQASFFDLFYNYFTENNEEESQEDKNEIMEVEALGTIKRKILMEDKEGDYMEYIEEKFDE